MNPVADHGDGEDDGLSAERTALAWRRSGLSLVACGVIMARGLGNVHVPARPGVGAVVVAVGGVLWLLANVEARRRLHRAGTDSPAIPHAELALFALASAGAGLVAFVIALLL